VPERLIAVVASVLVLAGMWWLAVPSALSEQGSESPPHDRGTSGLDAVRPSRATPATVVRLVDGDTLVVRADVDAPGLPAGAETRVRLLEVDTPESVDPGSPVECYAERASAELARLAPPGSRVWALPDQELFDVYGRTLLYLWNDRGQLVNLELVRSGAAEAVLHEPNDRYIDLVRRAESRARGAGRGLWGACS
jgi:micrococcal nuclease